MTLKELYELRDAVNNLFTKDVQAFVYNTFKLEYTLPLTLEKYKGLQDRCHKLVAKAVEKGFIKKERCKQCRASKTKSNAHHPDYTQPFKIIWLCNSCHRKLHVRIGLNKFLLGKIYTNLSDVQVDENKD